MRPIILFTASVFLPLVVWSQDPVGGKKQPGSRPLDAAPAQNQSREALPAIDLPEFVITGNASINPPDVQRERFDETGFYKRGPAENIIGPRDRETVDLGQRFKQSLLLSGPELNGMLTASLGNYFSPFVHASVGLRDPSYDVAGTVGYYRTKGFRRGADASAVTLDVGGGTTLSQESATFGATRINGGLSFKDRSYKFYGSVNPLAQREVSVFGFNVAGASEIASSVPVHAGLTYHAMNVADSSTKSTENSVFMTAGAEIGVFDVPIKVDATLSAATVTASQATNLSLTTLGLVGPTLSWGSLFLRLGVKGFAVVGMNGQGGNYLYPHFVAGFQISQDHALRVLYEPQVTFSVLRSSLEVAPYLSSQAKIRHSNARFSLGAEFESEWNERLRTKVKIVSCSLTDYPLYADTSRSGHWLLTYGGTTTVTSVEFQGVANITPNDYFAVGITSRIRENSVYDRVPMVPGFEASALFRHSFKFDVIVEPSFSYADARPAALGSQGSLDACLWSGIRMEYLGVPAMTLFVESRNLVNRLYSVWDGYRAEPFRLVAGLTYRW